MSYFINKSSMKSCFAEKLMFLSMCVLSIRVVVTVEQTQEEIEKAAQCIREAAVKILK